MIELLTHLYFFTQGSSSIQTPAETYTGENMMLICGPNSTENIDIGPISGSVWKLNDLEIMSSRFKIVNQSKLIVNNVIPEDAGKSKLISF